MGVTSAPQSHDPVEAADLTQARRTQVAESKSSVRQLKQEKSVLDGPAVNPDFVGSLDQLVAIARQGHRPDSQFFNPPDGWLISRMPVIQDLPKKRREQALREAAQIEREAARANEASKAADRAGPEAVVRLDTGGLAFFSQLGVARRPDLTQYFVDGFARNRDALAFDESSQALFAEVFPQITRYLKERFAAGDTIVQTDRQIGDAPGRSFHARQLLCGTRYLQLPYMWRQLTFEMPESDRDKAPDILEVSIPNWLDDLELSDQLKKRIESAGLAQLIFKAPTKGLSLHLGFDYVGEHKMGPLSIAMFLVKQADGLAIQAALSVARVRELTGATRNTALVTLGPSLHGKSTLTIMIELGHSELAERLGLAEDPEEGVYPMNDDIVLLQELATPVVTTRNGSPVTISHGIDGTENNFYAVPFGLTYGDDPISYDVLRGTTDAPNPQETLENVPVDAENGIPDFLSNPVRNMRMILSRRRLLSRKGATHLLEEMTDGTQHNSVHVPMEHTDRVFWQAVMRQNTVIPPLRRLNLKQYIRGLMYGEAVQMGAAAGAIGRPYIEYFSDPFIIGLEDENANSMYRILSQMSRGGPPQHYYVFNTGGVGADTNDEASGPRYKKIPRELTLMLQEALLRDAVKFEHDADLRSDVAVAVVDASGETVVDLREEWLPRHIYGETEYLGRIDKLTRRRYYGLDAQDRAGILRYTKVADDILELDDVPAPRDERELASLLSFYWHVDHVYPTLADLRQAIDEGHRPSADVLSGLQEKYEAGLAQGLDLSAERRSALRDLGVAAPG